MFRWLFKPRFYSKCLSYVKFMKTRLEIIQKRKKAEQKFMKSDIADLLRSGLDYDAYIRAKRLLLEQNMLSCYEMIEKFVGCISDHVEDLTKQNDCPDECKEAVPSLIYAAARFADLPELRDLRTLFTEKFGNSLEPCVNKEFVEKLRPDPPTEEMKIGLLYDIAQEFSLDWDEKALRRRLYAQSSLYEERPNPGGDSNPSKGKERDILAEGRKDFNDESLIHQSGSDYESSTHLSSHDGRKGGSSSSFGSVSEDEVETKRPISYSLIPPPYRKKKSNTGESNSKKARTHVRGKSVPSEPTTAVETSKGHTRSISVESGVRGGGWRVHPNLPDYDELKAHFLALRRR